MTEQPDTAAIRAQCDNHGWYSAVILDLCDAVDAARTDLRLERHDARADLNVADQRIERAEARAEAAEAQVREDVLALDEAYAMLRTALARAKVAEAEALRQAEDGCTEPYDMDDIERALTEGTGQ